MNKFTLTIFTAAALALTAYSRLRPPAEKTVYAAVTPVSRLATKANRNPVTLQGHLISKLGPENEDWNGLYIHRSDKVQIHGELRKAWFFPPAVNSAFIQKFPTERLSRQQY